MRCFSSDVLLATMSNPISPSALLRHSATLHEIECGQECYKRCSCGLVIMRIHADEQKDALVMNGSLTNVLVLIVLHSWSRRRLATSLRQCRILSRCMPEAHMLHVIVAIAATVACKPKGVLLRAVAHSALPTQLN